MMSNDDSHWERDRELERDHERESRRRGPVGRRPRLLRARVAAATAPTASDGGPIVELRPTGNGVPLYRALARILVRRELFFAGEISADDDCEPKRAAG
jgi:hypothetical protein